MRLKQKEIEIIKSTLIEFFGECRIKIFGSRLDENKRGGDIDIFIIPSVKIENERLKKAKASLILEEKLLKPVDILIHKDFEKIIEQEAMRGEEII